MENRELPQSNQNKAGWCFDTLFALLSRAPLESGDIPSKSGVADLIERGWAAQVVLQDDTFGYAATPDGRDAFCKYYGVANLSQAFAKRLEKVSLIEAKHEIDRIQQL